MRRRFTGRTVKRLFENLVVVLCFAVLGSLSACSGGDSDTSGQEVSAQDRKPVKSSGSKKTSSKTKFDSTSETIDAFGDAFRDGDETLMRRIWNHADDRDKGMIWMEAWGDVLKAKLARDVDGFQELNARLYTIDPNEFETGHNFVLSAPIIGQVLDESDDSPVAGVIVEFGESIGRTDETGHFEMPGTRPQTGRAFVITHDGYRMYAKQHEFNPVSPGEFVIKLEPDKSRSLPPKMKGDITVSGHVYDAVTGEPLMDVLVTVIDENTDVEDVLFQKRMLGVATQKDGSFSLEERVAGKTELTAMHSYKPYKPYMNTFELTAENASDMRIELQPVKIQVTSPIGGRVLDAQTRDPLADVIVFVDEARFATTDESGKFLKLRPKEDMKSASLKFVLSGYESLETELDFTDHKPNQAEFLMEPYTTGAIAGRVTDRETGDPVSGATVRIGDARATTQDDGRYTFDEIEAGEIRVSAAHEAYLPYGGGAEIKIQTEAAHDIQLEPIVTGTLTGSVTDAETGKPLAGVTVSIGKTSKKTQDDGRYELADIMAGKLTVVADKDRYKRSTNDITLERNAAVELDFKMEPVTTGDIQGVALDKVTKKPLSGVTIRVAGKTVETDQNGQFQFSDIAEGEMTLLANKPLYEDASHTLTLKRSGTADVTLHLSPITWGTVMGRAVNADTGAVLAGVKLDFGSTRIETDADGNFRAEKVPSGDMRFMARLNLFEAYENDIAVEPAKTTELNVEMVPVTYGSLSGTVTDKVTTDPIPNAVITVGDARTEADENGQYAFDKLDAGDLAIGAKKAGYHSRIVNAKLEPGDESIQNIALDPITEGTVAGQVTDVTTGKPIAGVRISVAGQSVETDANGRFELMGIDVGKVSLSGRHADYDDGEFSGDVLPDGTLKADFTMDLRKEDVRGLEKALTDTGTVDLYGIYFDSGKSDFKQSSLSTLNAVKTVMERAADKRFMIAGHTDSDGSDTANQTLSELRAAAVIRWLVDNGIASERLSGEGYGEARPTATNETQNGKALNRRVQLSFTE